MNAAQTQPWGVLLQPSKLYILYAYMGHRLYENVEAFKKTCSLANWSVCNAYLCQEIDSEGRLFYAFPLLPEFFSTFSSLCSVYLIRCKQHGKCSKTRRRESGSLDARAQLDSCCHCNYYRSPPGTDSPQEGPWPTDRRSFHDSIFGQPMPPSLESWASANRFPRSVG